METEQLQKILQAFKNFEKADIFCAIVVCIGALVLLICMIYEIHRMKKIQQWRKEYELTLTEEQRQKLKEWRNLGKWVYLKLSYTAH